VAVVRPAYYIPEGGLGLMLDISFPLLVSGYFFVVEDLLVVLVVK
jgi:hypothetical protein